jgi:methyl-accepting chemotaxis protein
MSKTTKKNPRAKTAGKKTRTIKKELTNTVIFLSVIIILVLATILTSVSDVTKANVIKTNLQIQADYSGSKLEALIDSQKTFVKGIAKSAESYDLIYDKEKMKSVIRGYSGELDDEIGDLYIAYADNTVYMMTGNESKLPDDFVVTDRSWYKEAVNSKEAVAVSDPYVDAATGNLLITISSPVDYRSGMIAGVIAEDFLLSKQTSVLKSINFNDGAYAFLLDSSNNYVCEYKDGKVIVPKDTSKKAPASITSKLNGKTARYYVSDSGTRLLATHKLEDSSYTFCVSSSINQILFSVITLIVIALAVAAVSIIAIIVIMNVLISKELKPVSKFMAFIKQAVVGGDMPHMKTETDEISYLADQMQTRFIGTIKKTSQIAKGIGSSVSDTSSQIRDMSGGITEISSTMEETAASIDEQTSKIQSIDEACREVETGVNDLAEKATEMATNATDIIEKVDSIVPELMKSKDNTISITQTSRKELEAAIEGAKSINEIVNISKSIKDIADQTNLLSLNASIEAARAGEAGRGFAVVAEQISSLSSSTNTQISQVNEIIEKVLASVNALSSKSSEILNFINSTVIPDYGKFSDLADSYSKDAHYYNDVSGTLGATSEELSASITNITNSIATINEIQAQLSKGIENINNNLQAMTESSATVVSAAESMKNQSSDLSSTVDSFNV